LERRVALGLVFFSLVLSIQTMPITMTPAITRIQRNVDASTAKLSVML
jgi:hypothetical protein